MIGSARFSRHGSNDHIGAESFQITCLLDRRLVGHYKDAFVTFDCGGDGQTDTGVAGGCFDDCAARPQETLALGRLDH